MNRIALLELADFLETLDLERFDITTWPKPERKKLDMSLMKVF